MADIQETIEEVVEVLLRSAIAAEDSGDAMRFAQAALNAAHTKYAMRDNDDN